MNNFKNYSKYYDLLYADKDYKSEVNYIIELIRKYSSFSEKLDLLDLGAGTGVHGNFFAEKGFNVVGIEKSEEMIQIGSKSSPRVSLIQGDICDFSLKRTFDIATSLFHVISYLTENKKVESVIQNVYKHLRKGGLFIFDVWYSPAVHHLGVETRVKKLRNEEIEITRIAIPNSRVNLNIVDVMYEILIKELNTSMYESVSEKHTMRHFSIPELCYFFEKNGFRFIDAQEFMTGLEPSINTWGVCLIFQKEE